MRSNDPEPLSVKVGLILGLALVVVGIGASLITLLEHWTSLLPAIFGVIIIAFAWLGRKPEHRLKAVYGIGVVGFLGALGSVRGLPAFFRWIQGEEVASVVAAVSQFVVFVIGAVLVGFVTRDLRRWRRDRRSTDDAS